MKLPKKITESQRTALGRPYSEIFEIVEEMRVRDTGLINRMELKVCPELTGLIYLRSYWGRRFEWYRNEAIERVDELRFVYKVDAPGIEYNRQKRFNIDRL